MRRQKKLLLIALSIMIILLFACNQSQDQSVVESQKEQPEAQSQAQADDQIRSPESKDIELSFAENFNIKYLDEGMKVITDMEGREMLLLHKNQTAPSEYSSLPAITIPLSEAIYTSTTQVGFLRAFENDSLFDSIVGVRMAAEDWDFDAMKNRMIEGKIVDIGSNTSQTDTYDYEIIQSLQPNLIFLSGGGMHMDEGKLVAMLDGANIPYLSDGSSKETDYRGTMEWIKFYATFYDLDKEAEDFFNAAMARIDDVIDKVKDAKKPKVGWAIVSMGKVYVEDSGSKTAQLVRDAGGEYLFDGIGNDSNSVTSITVEELYDRLSGADLLINRGMPKYGPDKKSITDQAPALAELDIFKEDRVWQITDNFWSTYHTIDRKYIELAAIFHPELFPDVEITTFRLMPDVQE